MKTVAILLVGFVSVLVAACGSAGSATTTTGAVAVNGYVHAGPVCPVMQNPPDPACADRPVADAVMQIFDVGGDLVATGTTAADGTFTVRLGPGSYTLEPQPVAGLLGTPGRQDFVVGATTVMLDVAYDTGIR